MPTMKKAWTYLVIALLALGASLNYELFVFPNQFAPAGLNGICTMIQHLSGISVGYLSLLINVPLAIWCYIEVSKPIATRFRGSQNGGGDSVLRLQGIPHCRSRHGCGSADLRGFRSGAEHPERRTAAADAETFQGQAV